MESAQPSQSNLLGAPVIFHEEAPPQLKAVAVVPASKVDPSGIGALSKPRAQEHPQVPGQVWEIEPHTIDVGCVLEIIDRHGHPVFLGKVQQAPHD